MNIVTFLPKMNVMMAEDVSVPALRNIRCHENVHTAAAKRRHTEGLWNRNFERMFLNR